MSATRPDFLAKLASECAAVMAQPLGQAEVSRYPLAVALVEDAMTALETAIPARFEHEGRTYMLRSRLVAVDLGIHPDASSATPMLRLRTEGLRWLGYRPGH
ncbi:MAG: hypothetical protein KGJ54_12590 [Betaproteobacteria bacterium]|jgi:hypothetical protein|nr:hypothetical protein [Betaproteobacteria bacterium]